MKLRDGDKDYDNENGNENDDGDGNVDGWNWNWPASAEAGAAARNLPMGCGQWTQGGRTRSDRETDRNNRHFYCKSFQMLQMITTTRTTNTKTKQAPQRPASGHDILLSVCLCVCVECVHGNRLQRGRTLPGLTLSECCLLVMGGEQTTLMGKQQKRGVKKCVTIAMENRRKH